MIIHGDCLEILTTLPDNYVNCCITSPPYYGLRDYGVKGQIGLEKTLQEYIDKLVDVFREVRRVLKNDGTLWVNMGDTYCSTVATEGMKPKDLMGIPWMLAFALRADGWYLRQDIIWHKTNSMPESVKDRCTKAHEYIFLLSKSRKYYFDNEAIKEPCVGFNNELVAGSKGTFKPNTRRSKGNNKTFRGGGVYTNNRAFNNSELLKTKLSIGNTENKTGLRNKRDVWSVGTTGYKGAHFATFPEKLIEPCVLAGCPTGGIVLDPFFGSGTTGRVARKQGRNFVGIELNPDYCELAENRCNGVN